MEIRLERFSYSPTETEGRLLVADQQYATIERPWRGNERFVSCIPDGEYMLEPWDRPNGDKVFILVNPDLDVYPS